MAGGWIKLHRKLLESNMFNELNNTQRDLLIVCLLSASHEENSWVWKGKKITCEPGQFITSLDKLSKKCAKGTTIKGIRTALKVLKNWGFISIKEAHERAHSGTVVTICKWADYQSEFEAEGTEKGTNKGTQRARVGATIKKKEDKKKEDNTHVGVLKLVDSELSELNEAQLKIWNGYQKWFNEQNFEYVIKLKEQIKPKELIKLLDKASSQEVKDKLLHIENSQSKYTKNKSVYLTINNWLNLNSKRA